MRILVTGSTGLIGSALVAHLRDNGHDVTRLVRFTPSPDSPDVRWDPIVGTVNTDRLQGTEAVVHLAGENIAKGRWSAEKKVWIRDSRVLGTRLLCEAIVGLVDQPRILVSASAIGYYGDRGDEIVNEESPPGSGFLPDVCRQWEKATEPASQKGLRVVHLRIGVVLSPRGGALSRMLTPFKMGIGGKLGSGNQYFSWITLDDVVGAISHCLSTDSLEGPVNAVAPNPVTNSEYTKTLGRVLTRPTIFPMPAFAARLAFGEMADALLLASTRVEPARLKTSGYQFLHPDLEGALRHLLGKE